LTFCNMIEKAPIGAEVPRSGSRGSAIRNLLYRNAANADDASVAVGTSQIAASIDPRTQTGRQGIAELGEFEDAVILKTFGDVPDDFRFVT
jgi:hypothetical protein